MYKHLDLSGFLRDHPYLMEFKTKEGITLIMDIWKVGIIHNMEELTHIMEKLAQKLEFFYFDGRIYRIEAIGDKIIIKNKF